MGGEQLSVRGMSLGRSYLGPRGSDAAATAGEMGSHQGPGWGRAGSRAWEAVHSGRGWGLGAQMGLRTLKRHKN